MLTVAATCLTIDRLANDAAEVEGRRLGATIPMVYYPENSMRGFIGGVTAAFLVKITSGVDDIVWLAPYLSTLSRRNNLKNSITYVWMCGFQTILALVVSSASSNSLAGNSNPASWSGDKCLIVTAGSSLLCYGAFLLWEHHRDYRRLREAEECPVAQEEGRGAIEAISDRLLKSCTNVIPGVDTVAVAEAAPLDEHGVRRKLHEMQIRGPHGNLLVLAFLGSIDDLTLFVPMLMGSRFIWYQLLLGATFASIIIVTLGLALMLFSPAAVFVRQIPIGLIVLLYASFLVFKGLSMH